MRPACIDDMLRWCGGCIGSAAGGWEDGGLGKAGPLPDGEREEGSNKCGEREGGF
jgi:hypothetical protein